MDQQHGLWTIGHSTRSLNAFFDLLKAFEIEVLVDVRRFPGSKRYPHFNKEEFRNSLEEKDFDYFHFEDLGGRRKKQDNSKNTAWRLDSFQGYADYMETADFKNAIEKLKNVAQAKKSVIMCAEAVWWSCHRSLIADYLKNENWLVQHIMDTNKSTEHPYTQPAKIVDGELRYD